MNVLVVHDLQALASAAPQGQPIAASVTLRDVRAADLAQLIARADLVALTGSIDAGDESWARAFEHLAARDVPMVRAASMPSPQSDSTALSGTCGTFRLPDGTLEVRCIAHQAALRRFAALMRGERHERDGEGPGGRRITRFVFEGP